MLRRVKTCGLRLLLVTPFWPSQTWFSELISLLDGDTWEIQEGPTLSASGQDLAPTSRDLEVVGLADHRPSLALETIDSVRALSTRKLYSSKIDGFRILVFG